MQKQEPLHIPTSLEIAMARGDRAVSPIPQMTDKLGAYWKQPHRNAIEIDDKHAYMSHQTFEALLDYSNSQPTGVYVGKMWRAEYNSGWHLCWFGRDPTPGFVSNNYRLIVIMSEQSLRAFSSSL